MPYPRIEPETFCCEVTILTTLVSPSQIILRLTQEFQSGWFADAQPNSSISPLHRYPNPNRNPCLGDSNPTDARFPVLDPWARPCYSVLRQCILTILYNWTWSLLSFFILENERFWVVFSVNASAFVYGLCLMIVDCNEFLEMRTMPLKFILSLWKNIFFWPTI